MKFAAIAAVLALLSQCAGPPYSRPNPSLPPEYRDQRTSTQLSLGDLGWWQVFDDPELQQLLTVAVAQNYDVQVAAQRIQEADANYTAVAANLYPQLNAVLSAQYTQINGERSILQPHTEFAPQGLLTASYEVDLFGKVHSQTAKAAAQVLESEYARETVLSSVVSSVATLYFQLRELDDELRISKETLVARTESLKLVKARLEGGIGTLQDVRQAEGLVAQMLAAIPLLERTITQTENTLSILLGGYPHSVPRGLPLQEQVALPDVPEVGIPSQLVERRPDIRSAEENLIAANAQIGVAKSLLFPQVMITAATGGGTTTINGNSFGQTFVSVLPQLVQQIFNAGAARAGVSGAEAAREEALLQYVQSIHQGFGDVSDALVAYERDRESVAADSLAMAAATDSLRLANLRYEGGVTSYLEVLVSQQNAYGAEIDLEQQQLAWRLSVIQLYSALGGGWQPPPAAVAQPPQATPAPPTPTPAMATPAGT